MLTKRSMRKLPQTGPASRCRALDQQDAPASPNDHRRLLRLRRFGRTRPHWDLLLQAESARDAVGGDGTFQTAWRGRCADESPQLHERLIELADVPTRQQCLRRFPQPGSRRPSARIVAQTQEPAEHALTVRFEDRQATIVSL